MIAKYLGEGRFNVLVERDEGDIGALKRGKSLEADLLGADGNPLGKRFFFEVYEHGGEGLHLILNPTGCSDWRGITEIRAHVSRSVGRRIYSQYPQEIRLNDGGYGLIINVA